MGLDPLVLGAAEALGPAPEDARCAFCGTRCGPWGRSVPRDGVSADGGAHPGGTDRGANPPRPACPLCALARTLSRARVEEEARLVWLPEVSQPALSALARRMGARVAAAGERHDAAAGFLGDGPGLRAVHAARAALLARAGEAEARTGTSSPRDLARALRRLSPAAAARLPERIGGLRVVPLGRLFEGDADVFPDLAALWAAERGSASSPDAPAPSAVPAP